MLAKLVLNNIPQECNCEVEELPNQTIGSSVKGYTLKVECPSCKSKREVQNIESNKQRRKQEILTELNQLDLKAIRPLIDKDDVKIQEIKSKKGLLRTELQNII
mgnify:CR=1 FL=1